MSVVPALCRITAVSESNLPEILKTVEASIQKQFGLQQRERISLSELSAGHFEQIRQYVRMTVQSLEWSAALSSPLSLSSSIPAFQWSDENENQQYERYLQYLVQHLSVPRHLLVKRAPVGMLDTLKSRLLPFDLTGTSDVMIVEKSAGTLTPIFGVRMLFEMKKPNMMKPQASYQAMGELLAADQHTPFAPIVVLTDLVDYWRFCWLEGKLLRYLESPNRSVEDS